MKARNGNQTNMSLNTHADMHPLKKLEPTMYLQFRAQCMCTPASRKQCSVEVIKCIQYIIVTITLAKTDICDVTTSTCSDNVTMAAHNADILTLEVSSVFHFLLPCPILPIGMEPNFCEERKIQTCHNIHKVKMSLAQCV